jgi:hypothetical protein
MARKSKLNNPHIGVFTNRNPLNFRHAKVIAVTERRRIPEDSNEAHFYAVWTGYQGLHMVRVRLGYSSKPGIAYSARRSETWDYCGLHRTKSELIQCLLECPPPPMQRDEINLMLERLGYPGEDA